jgi:hypothetical protein
VRTDFLGNEKTTAPSVVRTTISTEKNSALHIVTSEGHPGARLQRALGAGNLIAARSPGSPLGEAGFVADVYPQRAVERTV